MTSAFFGVKNLKFFKIYDVSTWTSGRGLSQGGHGGGQFFEILCGRILCTAPNVLYNQMVTCRHTCRYDKTWYSKYFCTYSRPTNLFGNQN